MTKAAETLKELEKQSTETSLQAAEATNDDLPLEQHNITINHMYVDPATTKPSSPIKPPSPMKPTEEKANDVTITGLGYTAPSNLTALSKHSTKE
mgnify:CR=1 FL=1